MIYKCRLFIDFFFPFKIQKETMLGKVGLNEHCPESRQGAVSRMPPPPTVPPALWGEVRVDTDNKREASPDLWHVR